MLSLVTRKLILMLIILAILNYIAYHYALIHPNLLPSRASEAAEEAENHYPEYLQNVLRGDLGEVASTPVAEVIAAPIKNSLILLLFAVLTTIVLGLLFGFLSISYRTKRIRPLALTFLAAGSSMPGFVFGAILLSLMVYQMLYGFSPETLFPISGYGLDRHLILPVAVLALQPTFHLARVTAGLLENELQKDYIQVARSKGLSWWQLFWRHALPNMIAPILITIGAGMRLMVGELVIVEAIFLWPGIGRILLFSLGLRLDARPPNAFFGNPNLIAAIAVVMGFWLLLADLLVTLLAYHFDPRLRQEAEEAEVVIA
jgi:peptide/nickel transport system permease protein